MPKVMKLRTLFFDTSTVHSLWLDVQTVFMDDPVKYPSAMAAQDDVKAGRPFLQNARRSAFRQRLGRLVVQQSEPLNHHPTTVLAYITI